MSDKPGSTVNLDLSDVASEDHEKLASRIESFYKLDGNIKSSLSFHWERNHLMLDGKQWIVYDGDRNTNGQWRQLSVSRSNEYIPRPVTNYIYDIYQTLKSYLIQNKPRSTVVPNTQLYRDKQAAKLATLVCEVNFTRLKEAQNYEAAAACGIAYGTVFKKDYWDTSTIMMAKVPRTAETPITDPMTGAVIGYSEQEVKDPETGETIYDELPLGDVNTAIVEPYRIALDPLAVDLHTARWIMEYSIQALDWIKETFEKDLPGFTGKTDEVKEERSLSNSMRRFYQLRTSTGVKSSGATSGTLGGAGDGIGSSGDSSLENTAVVKEYYERPSSKYPKGRMIVVANGVTLYAGDSPYEGPELGDWHPYSEFRWEVVPGRFWGKSPLDDATEIQKHINSIDATIILTRKTMAIPQKLIPHDTGIKPGEWTGRPGQEIRYRATGSKPETVEASGVDGQVFREREQKVEDIKVISGAIDILKGDRPPGVTAASALEMLFEVGTGKLRPVLDRWKVFVESSQKKQLKLTANKYREPRPEFIKMLQAKNKELSPEDISKFIGEDLHDNSNVLIEAGSNVPKLQSAEKAMLLQLAQIGVLNLQDPQNRLEFNKRMGVVGFNNEVAPDVKRAEWENDLIDNIPFAQGGDTSPVVLADDIHPIHKEVHTRRMKEPSFMSQPPEVQQAYIKHVEEHQMYIDMAKEQQMQEAAMGMPPAPSPGEPAPLHPAGKGLPAPVASDLMGSEIKRPA